MRTTLRLTFSLVLCWVISACTTGNCRRAETPAGQPQEQTMPQGKSPIPPSTGTPPGNAAKPSEKTVFVYKADGSLQCGMGRGKSPEEMEKELKGITVYSRSNKPDRLMHIQVCGSPTGMVNVYEIPEQSLKDAEGRGFKKWQAE